MNFKWRSEIGKLWTFFSKLHALLLTVIKDIKDTFLSIIHYNPL